ncbi:MAG: RsmE family RNA methyltransferase [bacterium]|nr:RsmE family RNA methyltransferase [bacterium]
MNYLYDAALSAAVDAGADESLAPVIPGRDLRRHLAALRIRDGENVTIFDGKGLRAFCTLQGSPADGVLTIVERTQTPAPLPLTLAMGLLDSRDRLEFAIEKATELGVTSIVLLASDHASRMRATSVRILAKVIAACEQSGRFWLPEVHEPMSVEAFLGRNEGSVLILGDQQGDHPSSLQSQHFAVVVGPEGGFSQREQALFSADQRTLRWVIGRQRLRAETAAIAMLSTALAVSTN